MAMTQTEREKKARQYENYLREHDELARKVANIQSKFDLSESDKKEIESLQKEMLSIQRKSEKLGDYFG